MFNPLKVLFRHYVTKPIRRANPIRFEADDRHLTVSIQRDMFCDVFAFGEIGSEPMHLASWMRHSTTVSVGPFFVYLARAADERRAYEEHCAKIDAAAPPAAN